MFAQSSCDQPLAFFQELETSYYIFKEEERSTNLCISRSASAYIFMHKKKTFPFSLCKNTQVQCNSMSSIDWYNRILLLLNYLIKNFNILVFH
jgi:hypothetical protein